MPTAICDNGHLIHWRNGRGCSQPKTCNDCGAQTHRAKYDDGKWIKAPKKTRKRCEIHQRNYYDETCWKCDYEARQQQEMR